MIEEFVYILRSSIPLMDVVENRISPNVINQGDPVPAVVYTLLPGVPVNFKEGRRELEFQRVQIDVYGETIEQAMLISRITDNLLDNYRGDGQIQIIKLITPPHDFFEPDARYRRVMSEYRLTVKPAALNQTTFISS